VKRNRNVQPDNHHVYRALHVIHCAHLIVPLAHPLAKMQCSTAIKNRSTRPLIYTTSRQNKSQSNKVSENSYSVVSHFSTTDKKIFTEDTA